MPHFVEMPTFLPDDTGPMLSSSRPPYDLPNHLRAPHEKLNGNGRTNLYPMAKGDAVNGADLYIDNATSGTAVMNGNVQQHETSLHSIPNGRNSESSWDARSRTSVTSSTRSGAVNGVNGGYENSRRSPGPTNGFSRPSTNGDTNSYTSTHTTGTAANTDGFNTSFEAASPQVSSTPTSAIVSPATTARDFGEQAKRSFVPPPVSTNPQSTGPLTYESPLFPASPDSQPAHRPLDRGTSSPEANTTPHRTSAPPTYVPSPSPGSPASASFQPGPSQLKHRHTLQVPKVGSNRTSRDGEDSVYSTGRFSPPVVNGVGSARRGSVNLNRRNTQSVHSNMQHEEIPVDDDALRWAEAVKNKRASKRRKKEEEDDDRVVVGTKVDQNHVNWETAYNMLTGIRFTVSRTNAKLDRPLTDADFDARHKFSFDITGNELTPSAKYDFKFKDYAPWVFRHLRAKFKLDPADYLMSLTSKYILSELGSPGKSGSFFYFSRDYKYIIKTIHHAEHKFMRKILKEYYAHVEANPNTLLSQFYGLHRVKIPYGRKIHFVVMNNLFPPHRDIHQTFDLKGSTVGRDFKEEDLEQNPRATLKDLNWLRRNLHLEFGPEKKRLFIEQMEKDVELLQRLKIMDYSMLVGIHDLQKGNQENLRDKTLKVFQPGVDHHADENTGGDRSSLALGRTPSKLESAKKARELRQIIKQEKPVPMGESSSHMADQLEENATKREFTFYSDDGGFRATHEDNSPGEEIFFLSIIDCLTHYGTIKKLENLWKGLKHDKKLISPVAPVPYGERFVHFIEGITKSPEEAIREAEAAPPPPPQKDSSAIDRQGSFEVGRRSNSSPMHRTATNNATIQRNERDAMRSEHSGGEEHIDPRTISTMRSPSADRGMGTQGQVLPVVEEFGEASSTGSRSGRSRDPDYRPATPSKDAPSIRENGNAAGLNRTISRESLDKDLPPLPQSGRRV